MTVSKETQRPKKPQADTLPSNGELTKDKVSGELEQIRENLIEGTDGIAHLIYDTFVTKAQTFENKDIHRAAIEALWNESTPNAKDMGEIARLAVGKGIRTRINETGHALASEVPANIQGAIKEIVVKSGMWYALDERLRQWLERKLREFLTIDFTLGEGQDLSDFWRKQLRIPNAGKWRTPSYSFCPDVIAAANSYEIQAIEAMQALGDHDSSAVQPTYDAISAYIVGSLPDWNFAAIDNKTDIPVLRALRLRTLLEIYESGRPSTETLEDILWLQEKFPRTIPERLGTVAAYLQKETSRGPS